MQGKYAEAETEFAPLIKVEEKVLGPENPEPWARATIWRKR